MTWILTILIPIYAFLTSILLQYGYVSYYGIPTDYISVISRDSLLLVYSILTAVWSNLLGAHLYVWVTIVLALLLLYFLYKVVYLKKIVYLIISVPFILFLLKAQGFGSTMAELNTTFKIASTKCAPGNLVNYISPLTNNGEIIFVLVEENKIVKGSVITKRISDLPCGIEEKTFTPASQ